MNCSFDNLNPLPNTQQNNQIETTTSDAITIKDADFLKRLNKSQIKWASALEQLARDALSTLLSLHQLTSRQHVANVRIIIFIVQFTQMLAQTCDKIFNAL